MLLMVLFADARERYASCWGCRGGRLRGKPPRADNCRIAEPGINAKSSAFDVDNHQISDSHSRISHKPICPRLATFALRMGSREIGIVDCRDLTTGEVADRVPNFRVMEIEHNEFTVAVRGKRLDTDVLVPVLLCVVG